MGARWVLVSAHRPVLYLRPAPRQGQAAARALSCLGPPQRWPHAARPALPPATLGSCSGRGGCPPNVGSVISSLFGPETAIFRGLWYRIRAVGIVFFVAFWYTASIPQAWPESGVFMAAHRIFRLPEERQIFNTYWWTVRDAATAWGCSYGAARRWMCLHPEKTAFIPIKAPRSDAAIYRLCIASGTPKTISAKGNPRMMDPAWQREMSRRRWQKRAMSAAYRRKLVAEIYGHSHRVGMMPTRYHKAHKVQDD